MSKYEFVKIICHKNHVFKMLDEIESTIRKGKEVNWKDINNKWMY